MLEPPIAPTAPGFKDRRVGLILFGVLQILLGTLCAIFVPFMLWGQTMQARMTNTATDYRMVLPAIGLYGGLAVCFVCLGLGSMLARRWARALTLVLAWSWLATGVFSVVGCAIFLPQLLAMPGSPNPQLPPGAIAIAMAVALVMLTVLFIFLPASLLLFYQSRHVKATCESRDPVPRWTDACPLPVLGMALWLGLGAFSLVLVAIAFGGVIPLFGVLAHGLPGSLVALAMAGLWGCLAWGSYRVRPLAWWLTVAALGVFGLSAWVTFRQVDLVEMYRLMGYPEAQIDQIRRYSVFTGAWLSWWSVGGLIPMLGYLLWVKRFFRPGQPPQPS